MSQHLISTPAKPDQCRRCEAWTLTCHAGGLLARVDPIPIDELQELTALLDGRKTYNVHAETFTHRIYLEWRDAYDIKDPRKHAVLPEHKCGSLIGTPAPMPPPKKKAITTDKDVPPF